MSDDEPPDGEASDRPADDQRDRPPSGQNDDGENPTDEEPTEPPGGDDNRPVEGRGNDDRPVEGRGNDDRPPAERQASDERRVSDDGQPTERRDGEQPTERSTNDGQGVSDDDRESTIGTGGHDPDRPSPEPSTDEPGGPITQFRTSDNPVVVFVRELLSSAAIVVVIGAVLFGVSGVWPPMVAVESGSMNPHMKKGDLIFVTEPGRFPASFADDTGVVTTRVGEQNGHVQFGQPGSVVVYQPPGRIGPPIIHRARFYVTEGENWVDKADPSALPASSCDELPNCPAPHAGYFTKGDNNGMYDQVNTIRAPPVRPEWITGVARVRIPLLGWIRLIFSGAATTGGQVAPVGTTLPVSGPAGGVASAAPADGVASTAATDPIGNGTLTDGLGVESGGAVGTETTHAPGVTPG